MLLAHFDSNWQVGRLGVGLLPLGWNENAWVADHMPSAAELVRAVFPVEPWAFKDPRLSVMLPFWRTVVADDAAGVLVVRNPIEIARSLENRDGTPQSQVLDIWEYQMRSAVKVLDNLPVMVTTYEGALDNPSEWCFRTATWLNDLGLDIASDQVIATADHFDRNLRHQAASSDELSMLAPQQHALYASLVGACGVYARWQTSVIG
jgi:hypothetical protein